MAASLNATLTTTAENMDNLETVIDLIKKKLEAKSKFCDVYTFDRSSISRKSKPNIGTLDKKCLNLINDCLGCHRFDEAAKLTWIMCQSKGCFAAILYKCMMVVLENMQYEEKNETVMKFSSNIQDQIFINKLDVQLEYILYALRNNVTNIQGEYEKITAKRNKVKLKKIPLIEHILNAYCALLDYITWHNSCQDEQLSKNIADKAIAGLKNIINYPGTWDIFVLKLVEILEYYGNNKEIEAVLKKYVERNTEHINAYIYLCVHLHKHNADEKEFIQYAKELLKLCPSDVRVLLLVDTWDKQGKKLKERLKILFMYLDYPVNGKNKLGWQMLSLHLSQAVESNKSSILEFVKSLWHFRSNVWNYMYFNLSNISYENENDAELILHKVKVISILEPGLFAPSSSHALRHSAKRHMLAQEVETVENASFFIDHSKFQSDSLIHISGSVTPNSNRSTPSSMSTEGSLSDPCHTDGNCDSMISVCIKCAFNYSCVYGEDVNITCEVKNETKCKGNRTFTRTSNCRYCYQTPHYEHTCQINTSCHVVSAPRQRYIAKCIVKPQVLCLGNRVFTKNVPCNWTKGYSWGTALLLSIVCGGFGVDRFYLGMWQEGIGKLFSFGGLGVWTLVDVILIATGYLGPADHSLYIRN